MGGRGVVEQALGFVVAPQRPGQRRTRPEPPASSLRGFRAHGLWSGIGAPLPEAGLAMAHDWDCSDRAGRGRIAAGQRYLARLDQRRRAWLYHRRFSYGPFSSCRPINPTNLSRRRSSWLQIPPRDDRHGGDRPRHAHAMSLTRPSVGVDMPVLGVPGGGERISRFPGGAARIAVGSSGAGARAAQPPV